MARTLIDIACTESFASTVVAADAALRRRWVSGVRTGGCVRRHPASPGRGGRPACAEVCRRAVRERRGIRDQGGLPPIATTTAATAGSDLLTERHLSRQGRPRLSGARGALRVRRIGQVPQAFSARPGRCRRRRCREAPRRANSRHGVCRRSICLVGALGSGGDARQDQCRPGTWPKGHREPAESWAPGLWIRPTRYPAERCIGGVSRQSRTARHHRWRRSKACIWTTPRHVGTTTGTLSSHTTRCPDVSVGALSRWPAEQQRPRSRRIASGALRSCAAGHSLPGTT